MGAHVLGIKDMAGLCRPYAAEQLVRTLKQEVGIPIHFHTHDTSGLNAASVLEGVGGGPRRRGRRRVVDERHDQPAEPELARGRARAHAARQRARPRHAQPVRRLLGDRSRLLRAVRQRAAVRHGRGVRARDARRAVHESSRAGRCDGPGGAVARDCPNVCRRERRVRRHRQGHAVEQGRGRHGDLPRDARPHDEGVRGARPTAHADAAELGRGHVRRIARAARRRLAGASLGDGAPQPEAD